MEATAYVFLYSLLAFFLARICLAVSLFFCLLFAKDEKDTNPSAKFFMSRCIVLIKRIACNPFKVNINVPGLRQAETALLVFLNAYYLLNGHPGFFLVAIVFFLLADALIDNATELLPDSLSLIILFLFLSRGILDDFDYGHFAIYTAILCAAYLAIYIIGKGRGDMKLLAAITIGAGPIFAVISIAGSFFLYAWFKVVRRCKTGQETALAPFLCGGVCMAFLCAEDIEKLLGF